MVAAGLVGGLVLSLHARSSWTVTGPDVPLMIARVVYDGLLSYAIAIAIWQKNRTQLIWAWTLVGAVWGMARADVLTTAAFLDIPLGAAICHVAARFFLWPKPAGGDARSGEPGNARFSFFGAFILLGAVTGFGVPLYPRDWTLVVGRVLFDGFVAYLIGRYLIWIRPLPPPEQMGLRGTSWRTGWTMNRTERLIATSVLGFTAGCASAWDEGNLLSAIIRIALYTGAGYLFARLVWRKGWPDYDRKDGKTAADNAPADRLQG